MDYCKVTITIIGVFCMSFASCSNNGNVTKEEYDDIIEEYKALKEEQANTLAKNQELNELVDQVFYTLNSVSGRTFELGRNMENKSKRENLRRAEEIALDIKTIKEKLDKAADNEKIDESSKIIISKLRSSIQQKEEEITRLNKIIASQNEKITNLGNKVSALDNELGETNAKLDNTNAQLQATESKLKINEINSWIHTGDELINTANLLPNVKGHGNMKPIKKAKLEIILRAKECYKRAYELGGSAASGKMSEAERLYQLAN